MEAITDTISTAWTWLVESGVLAGILQSVASAAIIGLLAYIFKERIFKGLRKLMPTLGSKTPHINFEMKSTKTKSDKWKSVATVSNAGSEPAYNLYVHYYEQFLGQDFKVKALDAKDEISRAVLGIRDTLRFDLDGVKFDGCNVTSDQQIWVEYENSVGVNFRVVIIPPTPRGDASTIRPPKVVKRRFERMPGATLRGNKGLAKKAVRGRESYVSEIRKSDRVKDYCRWRFYALKEFALKKRHW